MTRLPRHPLILLPLVALLGGPAPPLTAADGLPEGARARLGDVRFGHGGMVTWIVPLPDGKRLLTMANDHRLHVWDASTAKQEREIALGQPFGTLYAAIAPDRKTVATAGLNDGVIRLWDLETGKEDRQFGGLPPNQGFYHLAWSPDGKSLLSYHRDRALRTWDVATGREVRQLALPLSANPNLTTAGLLARLMPDGKSLAVVEDWSVRVLDAENGKELRWFGGHTGPITTIGFSPDEKLLATVAIDRHARLWDVATGRTVAQLPLPVGGGRHLSFDGDGKRLAVGAADRTVRVFDVASAKQVGQIEHGFPLVTTFSLARDGKTLYLATSGESVVRSYDVGSGKELSSPTGHTGAISALAWSPDGKALATAGSADRSIILWDAAGKRLHQLPALEVYSTNYLQFSPDGKALLSFGSDRTLREWDVAGGKELRSFMCSPLPIITWAFSRDGKLGAVTDNARQVRVWDLAAGKELHKLDTKPAQGPANAFIPQIAFGGDGRTLLAYTPNDRVTRRWDAVSGKELGELKGATFPFGFQQALSADGRTVAANAGTAIHLTELATGKVRQTFVLPPAPAPAPGAPRFVVTNAAAVLSPDGRTLAAVTTDGTLRFWDAGTAKVLAERHGLAPNSRLLAFAPDGKTLAAAGPDPVVLLWDVPGPAAEGRFAGGDVTAGRLDDLWKELADEDAGRAWRAILSLESAPKEAVPFVRKQLKPGAALDDKAVARLIGQLDAEDFQEREKATEELIHAGKAAEEAVKKALGSKPSAEAKQRLEFIQSKMAGKFGPDQDELRAARGVEVLERIGTPEARQALDELAKGGESKVSAEARAAAERLKARAP